MIKYIITVLLLASCQSTLLKDTFQKNPPDEFMVVSNLPLTIPPNYKLMVPNTSKISTSSQNDLSLHKTYDKSDEVILNHMNQHKVENNIKEVLEEETIKQNSVWTFFDR